LHKVSKIIYFRTGFSSSVALDNEQPDGILANVTLKK